MHWEISFLWFKKNTPSRMEITPHSTSMVKTFPGMLTSTTYQYFYASIVVMIWNGSIYYLSGVSSGLFYAFWFLQPSMHMLPLILPNCFSFRKSSAHSESESCFCVILLFLRAWKSVCCEFVLFCIWHHFCPTTCTIIDPPWAYTVWLHGALDEIIYLCVSAGYYMCTI